MSTRWPGGIINGAAPVPTGGGAQDSASGVWTLEQADQYIATQTWPGTGTPDPQFQYVTALLHGDGTNGGQNNTFLDSSSNNFTITRNGNTTQGSFSPYGSLWSNYFNGTNSELTCTGSALSGQFTMEGWICFTSSFADATTYFGISSNNGGFVRQETSSTITFLNAGVSIDLTGSFTPVIGQWYHIAVTRNASNLMTIWVNGTSVGSATVSYSYASGTFAIGANHYSGGTTGWFPGYISNVRLVTGSCLYTANFTPSTTPLTAVSGTQVLTCQSNRFIDNSSNAYAITVNGSPTVQRFSPFQNLATYQTAKIGGSGYFDGTGDFLAVANNAVTDIDSANWTWEAWVYPIATGGEMGIGCSNLGTNSTGLFRFGILSDGNLWCDLYDGGSINVAPPASPYRAWHHFAITKSGSTITMYYDGVSVGSFSKTTTILGNSINVGLGAPSSVYWGGYISSHRLVVGSVLYTTTFTPPSTPPTAISNTRVLANFTNGAVFDSDATNVLETVGNAQISTSVVKYGTGSMAFDGTGDYLFSVAKPTTSLAGNFTIETWAYRAVSGNNVFFTIGDSIASTGIECYIGSSGTALQIYSNNATRISTTPFAVGTWAHLAVVRAGSIVTFYVNGNSVGTWSSTATFSGNVYIGAEFYNGSITASCNGFLDDFRITTGYARYWYNFQPPTAPFPNYGGVLAPPVQDPLFDYNTLLLNGDGTNGAQNNTFLDSSTNNFTITRNGNTTQGSFSPYGSLWSNFFNGSNYLSLASTSGGTLDLSTVSTFTIEAWVFTTAYNTEQNGIITNRPASGSFGFDFRINPNGTLQFYYTGGSSFSTTATVPLNAWTHIAVTRSGSNAYLFINGVLLATSVSFSNGTNTAQAVWVGNSAACTPGAGGQFGYISNLRLLNGTALYTSTFTPSTTPLTAITNTQLLTCQSNRFIDNSSSARAITLSGSPSVQRFSPFNPTAPYSTSVIGGSGYFDGSDDITAASNAAFNQSGNFTIEYWAYLNANTNYQIVFGRGSDYITIQHSSDSGGMIRIVRYGAALIATGGNVNPRQWNHFALVRSGSTVTAYLNGVSVASGTDSTSTAPGNALSIGQLGGGSDYFTGYVSDVRFTNTAVYTSAFTPPTAPLTAISGTALLTSMTNAGIPDLAMQNNLETVGNAQVSTSVVKYGTGSLYFDGTGDYLSIPSSALFNQSGNFTIEYWAYWASNTNYQIVVGRGSGFITIQHSSDSGAMIRIVRYGAALIATGGNVTAGQWNHFALVRSGSTVTAYLNGNPVASGTDSTATAPANILAIGENGDGSNYLNGYVDDLRITNGIARYVQPFTPPTAALQTY
jgi:hypothetical protein